MGRGTKRIKYENRIMKLVEIVLRRWEERMKEERVHLIKISIYINDTIYHPCIITVC
jgi:hypothetical protein